MHPPPAAETVPALPWAQRTGWRECAYAHGWLLLRGVPCDADNFSLRALGAELGLPSARALSHRLRIVEAGAVQRVQDLGGGALDRYAKPLLSAGHSGFALHSDEAFLAEPARWVLLHCWRADPAGGGSSQLARRDEICALADPALRSLLNALALPYVCGAFPVVDAAARLRFNRSDSLHAATPAQRDALSATLDRLEALFERASTALTLQAGDLLVLDNWRTLHGRSAFGADSPRLLKRLRLR